MVYWLRHKGGLLLNCSSKALANIYKVDIYVYRYPLSFFVLSRVEEGEFLKLLGGRIKQLRLAKGLSQTEFGYQCNFEKSAMNRIEAGRTNPTILTLRTIANALEHPLTDLLTFGNMDIE